MLCLRPRASSVHQNRERKRPSPAMGTEHTPAWIADCCTVCDMHAVHVPSRGRGTPRGVKAHSSGLQWLYSSDSARGAPGSHGGPRGPSPCSFYVAGQWSPRTMPSVPPPASHHPRLPVRKYRCRAAHDATRRGGPGRGPPCHVRPRRVRRRGLEVQAGPRHRRRGRGPCRAGGPRPAAPTPPPSAGAPPPHPAPRRPPSASR
jgi:hypothetical protein